MIQQQMMQYMSQAEVRDYNRSAPARSLSEDKFYLKVFLLNDKTTKSAPHEGGPWKVAARAVKKIASTVVGRPLIIYPDPTRHFRGASGDPEEIIALQQKYAIGEFVMEAVNPASLNAYGIVEVFKEFVDEVKSGQVRGRPLPKYVSPLVEPYKMENGEVVDGRILHVQAVDTPGFSPMVAKVVGQCSGMLGQCMDKLRSLGAASQLKAYQQKLEIDMISKELVRLRKETEAMNRRTEIEQRRLAKRIANPLVGAAATKNPFNSPELGSILAICDMEERPWRELRQSTDDAIDAAIAEIEADLKGDALGASGNEYTKEELDFYDTVFRAAANSRADMPRTPSLLASSGWEEDQPAVLHMGSGQEEIDYMEVFDSSRQRW